MAVAVDGNSFLFQDGIGKKVDFDSAVDKACGL